MCSTRNTGLAASIGADTVIDYTRDDFTQGTQRYDVILDNVTNYRYRTCLRAHAQGNPRAEREHPGRWLGGLGRITKAQVMAPFVPQRIRACHGQVNQPDLLNSPDSSNQARSHGDRPHLPADRGPRSHPPPRTATRPRQDRHHHVGATRDPSCAVIRPSAVCRPAHEWGDCPRNGTSLCQGVSGREVSVRGTDPAAGLSTYSPAPALETHRCACPVPGRRTASPVWGLGEGGRGARDSAGVCHRRLDPDGPSGSGVGGVGLSSNGWDEGEPRDGRA